MADFSHFNENGRAKMVDVSEKADTVRTAVAAGRVLVNAETFELIKSGGMKKGDVLSVAQVGGIMGAKRTSEIIPMCHPIMISGVDIDISLCEDFMIGSEDLDIVGETENGEMVQIFKNGNWAF